MSDIENGSLQSKSSASRPVLMIRAWRLFKSLKMGIFLLAVICAVCIYGTMFYGANQVLGNQGIAQAKAKVFNSWWFFGLLGLFFVQFVLSTWHVTKMSFTIWWKRDFTRSREALTSGRNRAEVPVPSGPDHVEKVLQRRFTKAHREGNRFFAHAGIRQRIGPTIVHAGIVVILLAGLARIILDRQGYVVSEGRFIAAEGETRQSIGKPVFSDQIGGPMESVRLPYDITVLDFDEVLHPNSQTPAYFSSHLRIKDHRTGQVRVAKLDMNHSTTIGGYEFHQSGYQPIPPRQGMRFDFDVRDANTGERIGVTDAEPGLRVQVNDEDLYLEVDGTRPGSAWRLYSARNPVEPIEQGELSASAEPLQVTFRIKEFFPHFDITEEGPYTVTNKPADPAAHVETFLNGQPIGETIIFYDEQKAALVPAVHDQFALAFGDVLYRREDGDKGFENFDWKDPAMAQYVVAVVDPKSGETIGTQQVAFGEMSQPVALQRATTAEGSVPAGANYAVYPLGRSTKYYTILSVVREPVVNYYVGGVALIAIGALLTFSGRYRAFYGLWDEDEQRLLMALIPRFGRDANPKEFALLIEELSDGTAKPPQVTGEEETETVSEEEFLPAG